MMTRAEVLRVVVSAIHDHPIVFTTGHTCREAYHIADRPNHFYMVGSMGMAAAIGVGISRQSGRMTVVVDGDGSILMNPSALVLAGTENGVRLIHLVVDNGSYESTGGQRTNSARVDPLLMAAAVGYASTHRVTTADRLGPCLAALFGSGDGPHLVHAPVMVSRSAPPGRIPLRPEENARRLRTWLTTSSPVGPDNESRKGNRGPN